MGFLNNKAAKASSPQAAGPVANNRLEATIGANTSINGVLKADGDIRIDGAFEGQIEVVGSVIVGATGRVVASIKATNIHISGAVKGELVATEQLEISHTGKVWGDISANALHIEPGGMFRGQSAMQGGDEPLLLEAPAPAR